MALDSNRAARWAYDKLQQDATLLSLLGGDKVFRRKVVPGTPPPYIIVEVQSTQPPIGVIRTGHDTHLATPTTVRTSVWDLDSSENIEPIADRLCVLLDGAMYEDVEGGGDVYCCTKGTDHPREDSSGETTYVGWDILWDVDVKA